MTIVRPTGLDVFIYLRKSRKDIEKEKEGSEDIVSDTLERHRKQLMELVRREKHNLVDVFPEVVSGEYIIDRPEIQKMLRQVEENSVDAIVVMDLERLGRGDMFDMGTIYRTLFFTETLVITPTEVIDPTEENAELLFGIKSIVSRQELKNINRRLQGGRITSVNEGKFIGKKPPYGYLRNDKKRLVPDPDTAPVVKKIFELIANGAGRQAVCRYLDSQNVPPPESAEVWEQSTISWMIKNEAYTGTIIWGKTRQTKRNGKRIKKNMPREKWTITKNAHQAIVDEDLFKRANEAFSGRWRPPLHETKTLSNSLAGLVKCSRCGKSMLHMPKKDRPTGQFRCPNAACRPFQKGAGMRIVEEKLFNSLDNILENIEAEGSMLESKQQPSLIPEKEIALKKHQKDLVTAEKQKDSLHDLLEQGVYTIDVFMERQAAIVDRIKQCKAAIEKLQKEIEIEKEKEKHYDQFLPKAKTALQAYKDSTDPLVKNRLLKSIVDKVEYTRKKDWVEVDHFDLKIYLRI